MGVKGKDLKHGKLSEEEKAKRNGRPPKFETVEELETLVDLYFVTRKAEDRPPTISGLALFLEMSRETLNSYKGMEKFSDVLKKAKARVIEFAEENLYAGKPTGAIFALKNIDSENWRDRQEVSNSHSFTQMGSVTVGNAKLTFDIGSAKK